MYFDYEASLRDATVAVLYVTPQQASDLNLYYVTDETEWVTVANNCSVMQAAAFSSIGLTFTNTQVSVEPFNYIH